MTDIELTQELELESISMDKIPDEDPDWSYLEDKHRYLGESERDKKKYYQQDKDRLQALFDGQWSFIVIQAAAKIRINGVSQIISSGGLHGIEDDSDEDYFQEVFAEELDQLKSMLLIIGFDEKTIMEAVQE